MTNRPPTNVAASIHGRLLARAQRTGADFHAELVRYGNERLLVRIAASEHATTFVLKGATLFALWASTPHRPTRDVDLHRSGPNAPEDLARVFRAICDQNLAHEDGLVFHGDTVAASVIRENQEYEGVRITMLATLGKARISLQVDIGFGDALYPPPLEMVLPSMLGLPTGTWRAYRRETVVAEKFQAMVILGMGNSRMKDFFDLWILQRDFPFDGEMLAEAVRQTFEHRRTLVPAIAPLALTQVFGQDTAKRTQWRAFLSKSGLQAPDLDIVVAALAVFLLPVVRAILNTAPLPTAWPVGGPWQLADTPLIS
jgi:hypothetical protein